MFSHITDKCQPCPRVAVLNEDCDMKTCAGGKHSSTLSGKIWAVSYTPRPLHPRGRTPGINVPTGQRGGSQSRFVSCKKAENLCSYRQGNPAAISYCHYADWVARIQSSTFLYAPYTNKGNIPHTYILGHRSVFCTTWRQRS
jgi:hypothetical protein